MNSWNRCQSAVRHSLTLLLGALKSSQPLLSLVANEKHARPIHGVSWSLNKATGRLQTHNSKHVYILFMLVIGPAFLGLNTSIPLRYSQKLNRDTFKEARTGRIHPSWSWNCSSEMKFHRDGSPAQWVILTVSKSKELASQQYMNSS